MKPGAPDVHSYLGLALLGMMDNVGAEAAFRKELERDPTNYVATLQLGVLAKQDQRYEEARSQFNRCLDMRPADSAARYQLATVELATGKVQEAREILERLVQESPQFTEAHVSLATVYYRLKRKEDGDRERAIVRRLTAEQQTAQPGANPE